MVGWFKVIVSLYDKYVRQQKFAHTGKFKKLEQKETNTELRNTNTLFA